MWQKKPINTFRNRGDQIFNQIWPRDEIFQKSRQIIKEKINRGYNILSNGGKKLKYGLENLIIPYPS